MMIDLKTTREEGVKSPSQEWERNWGGGAD